MRIAQLLSGSGTGASRYALLLSRELAMRGHEVTLFHTNGPLVEKIDLGGVRYLEVDMQRRSAPLRDVHQTMKRLGIEVMHTHVSRAHAFGAILRVLFWRRGLVATAHSQSVQLHWVCNDMVIAPSVQTAEFHQRYNRVSRRRMVVIPNFVDLEHFAPVTPKRRRAARQKLALPADAFVIGSVGVIGQRKNQSDLVRTIGGLRRRGVDAHLVLAGGRDSDGEGRLIDSLIAELGLSEHVHLLGGRADVADLLPAFDVYAQSSRKEGLPLAVLEAMATGIPIFGTAVGGVPDVVPVIDRGNLVAFGDVEGLADRLAAVWRSPPERAAMAVRLPAAVAALSPACIIPRIEEVYERVVAGRQRLWGPQLPLAKA